MRRVLALVIIAAAIAVGAGLAIPSNAVTVNGDALSTSQLNDELAAIAASPSYQCFLSADAFLNGLSAPTPLHGVSPLNTWYAAPTVEWANTRTTDLALEGFMEQHDPAAFSPASLATSRAVLTTTMTTAIEDAYSQGSGQSGGFSCPGLKAPPAGTTIGAVALGSTPPWFQDEQVRANAAELGLQQLLESPLPTSGAALEAWYRTHGGAFDTTCLSFIETSGAADADLVAAKIAGGMSFSEAARRYSIDATTKHKGGALGCFSPTQQQWATVQHYVGNVATGHVSAPTPFPNSPAYLLFTVTKRTPNDFAAVRVAVATANEAANRTRAEALAVGIQGAADIAVDPAIGTWQPSLSGGTIAPPSPPPAPSVTNSSANVPHS